MHLMLLLLSIFFMEYKSIQLAEAKSVLYLVNNKTSKISPFVMVNEKNDKNENAYVLKYKCSSDFEKWTRVETPNTDFCKRKQFIGKIEEINKFLNSIFVSYNGPDTRDLFIAFSCFDKFGNNLFSFTQGLQVIQAIPITIHTNDIQIADGKKGVNQKYPILSVNPFYLISFDKSSLIAVTNSNLQSQLSLQKDTVYLTINYNPETNTTYPDNIEIYLSDAYTGLVSDSLIVTINIEGSHYKLVTEDQFLQYGFLLGISALLLLMIGYCLRQRNNNQDGNNLQASINTHHIITEAQNGSKLNDKSEMLTSSIVAWNRKLLDNLKKKSDLETQESQNLVSMSKKQFKKIQASDQPISFARENSRSSKAKPFDDLSEIQTDPNDLKSPSGSCGNSSFLEDFNL